MSGKKDQILGSIKETVGRVFGSENLERKGMEQKGEGNVERVTHKTDKQVDKNLKHGDPIDKDLPESNQNLAGGRLNEPTSHHNNLGVHDSSNTTAGTNPLHAGKHHGNMGVNDSTTSATNPLHSGKHHGTMGVNDSTTAGTNPLHSGKHHGNMSVNDSTTLSTSGINPLHSGKHHGNMGVRDSTNSPMTGTNPLHTGKHHGDMDVKDVTGKHHSNLGVNDSTTSGSNPLSMGGHHRHDNELQRESGFNNDLGTRTSQLNIGNEDSNMRGDRVSGGNYGERLSGTHHGHHEGHYNNDDREILGGFQEPSTGYSSRNEENKGLGTTIKEKLGFGHSNSGDYDQQYDGNYGGRSSETHHGLNDGNYEARSSETLHGLNDGNYGGRSSGTHHGVNDGNYNNDNRGILGGTGQSQMGYSSRNEGAGTHGSSIKDKVGLGNSHDQQYEGRNLGQHVGTSGTEYSDSQKTFGGHQSHHLNQHESLNHNQQHQYQNLNQNPSLHQNDNMMGERHHQGQHNLGSGFSNDQYDPKRMGQQQSQSGEGLYPTNENRAGYLNTRGKHQFSQGQNDMDQSGRYTKTHQQQDLRDDPLAMP